MKTSRPSNVLWLCVALLALGISGCASNPSSGAADAAGPATGDAHQTIVFALRAAVTSRDWTQAMQLAQRAVAQEPDRPDIAWLHLRICAATSKCDPAPLEARFRKLAPQNAAVWLGPLQRAQAQKDVQVEARILEQMSAAQEFNVYWTTSMHRLASAITPAQSDVAPLTHSLAEVAGWLGALLPPFAPMTKACNAETARDPTRRAACERIAQLLERSDTYIGEAVGLGVGERIAPPNSSAALDVQQRVALLNYRRETSGAIMNAQIEREKFSTELLKLLQTLPREQDVALAVMRWAGEPLTP